MSVSRHSKKKADKQRKIVLRGPTGSPDVMFGILPQPVVKLK